MSAVVGAVFLLASSAAGQAQTTRLIPIQRAPEAAHPGPRLKDRPHLNLTRPAGLRSRPELLRRSTQLGPVLPDTLRILVLRLQFQPDDDPLTTGDGTFDLRDIETFRHQEGHDIDAAPHNRGYVRRHMRALHNYWWANSGGALNLEADVFPTAANQAYDLPRKMAYYGFETPLPDLASAFETLVSDAVAAAGAGADLIDWEQYDAFVLFHAGADWQGNFAGSGDTPADLPTAYVMLGQPVAAGSRAIRDATIIPETVSQDGFVGAINGSFAHEFGHQLGLPDLYDTMGGVTAVGLFALMDSGGEGGGTVDELFVWGVLPAAISPWARIYMGWTVPAEIGPGESVDLIASTALQGVHDPPPGAKVALVGAGGRQAFLVEYRSDDLDGDPSVSLLWEDGVIDGTGALVGGEKRRTYEYDALLPGSGVLIWHLDEEVAGDDPDGNGYNNFEENTLQQDRLHRFLDIEEADGLQELGWFPGYVGDGGDFWLPAPTGPDRFGPFSEPSTTSWTGARTGLELEVVPHASPLAVRLEIGLESDLSFWTAPLPGAGPEVSIPWLIDPEGDGTQVVAVLDSSTGLHLFSSDGQPAAGANPVWTGPAPPCGGISVAGSALVVAAGDALYFLDGSGGEIGGVDLGAPAVRRPVGFSWTDGPRALVEVEGGLLLEVSPEGVEESWQLGGEASVLIYATDLFPIVAVGRQLFRVNRMGSGGLELIWTGVDETVDAAGFRPVRPGGTAPGVALLDRSGRLTLLDLSREPGEGYEYASIALPQSTGRLAVAYLKGGGWPPVIVVPTVEGIVAVEANGPRTGGWPPAGRGRAAIPSPHIIGTPLTIAYGVVAGVTDATELAVYGSAAELLPGGLRQLLWKPHSAVTLGVRDRGEGPLLLYSDSDSLRVISLGVFGLDWSGLVWTGPAGGAGGGGWAFYSEGQSAEPVEGLTNLYVYPNPARDHCRIRAEGLLGELLVRGFTQSGTYLGEVARLSGDGPGVYEAEWDTSNLAPGVYFLVAELADSSGSRPPRRYRVTVLVVR